MQAGARETVAGFVRQAGHAAQQMHIGQQRLRRFVGDRDLLHVHDGCRPAAVHQHVANVVHIDKAQRMDARVDAGQGAAQLARLQASLQALLEQFVQAVQAAVQQLSQAIGHIAA